MLKHRLDGSLPARPGAVRPEESSRLAQSLHSHASSKAGGCPPGVPHTLNSSQSELQSCCCRLGHRLWVRSLHAPGTPSALEQGVTFPLPGVRTQDHTRPAALMVSILRFICVRPVHASSSHHISSSQAAGLDSGYTIDCFCLLLSRIVPAYLAQKARRSSGSPFRLASCQLDLLSGFGSLGSTIATVPSRPLESIPPVEACGCPSWRPTMLITCTT